VDGNAFMSLSFYIDLSRKLLLVSGEGEVKAQDIEGYHAFIKAESDMQYCKAAFVDLSGSDVVLKNIPVRSIKIMARAFKHEPLLPLGAKVAIVVNNIFAHGLVRLFASLREGNVRVLSFKTREDAFAWLEIEDVKIPTHAYIKISAGP